LTDDLNRFESHLASHISTRSKTNHAIVTELLSDEVKSIKHNHGDQGLLFLRTQKISQVTFWQSLITKINYRLKENVLRAFYQVLHCCVEAHQSANEARLASSSDFDPTPIWILPFVFERLVLAPCPWDKPDLSKGHIINQLIQRPIRLF